MESEIKKFVFVSTLYFLGFVVLYLSCVSLNSITALQAKFIELLILNARKSAFEVFISIFSGILIAVSGLVIFCIGLSFLAVKKLDKLKYFLLIPILCSGFLFNFSILYLFFGLGLFVSSLYIIPLGETYKLELKKWKKFRVGSNAISKALFVLFLFVFFGSLISFSVNDSYRQLFFNTSVSSITNIINAEMSNYGQNSEGNATNEIINQAIEDQMKKIRSLYPNLTEEQYLQMKDEMRKKMKEINSSENIGTNLNMTSLVSQRIKNSLIFNAILIWFPLIMSFTIWVFLEFLTEILFSPVSGIFSYIWFSVFGEE